MKVYTLNGAVKEGAIVSKHVIAGGKINIPVIKVGEKGRGRKEAIIPIQLFKSELQRWKAGQTVTVHDVKLGQTQSGRPKLIQCAPEKSSQYLGVFLTKYGFRGSSEHLGAWLGNNDNGEIQHKEFPGTIIAEGMIADGAAGRMADSKQFIATVPNDQIVCVGRTGRLYGSEPFTYYQYYAGDLVKLSQHEMFLYDCFDL